MRIAPKFTAAMLALSLLSIGCGSTSEQSGTAVTLASAVDGDDSATDTEDLAPGEETATTTDGASAGGDSADDDAGVPTIASTGDESEAESASTSSEAPAEPGTVRPDWLGNRVLPTDPDGRAAAQVTPPEMEVRRFPTVDIFPAPAVDEYQSSVEPVPADVLARSTWEEGCPVTVDELRYLRMTFWGFDDQTHEGEMIVHADVADDVVGVFAAMYAARFPVEEMRVTAPAELDAEPTGDGNNTTAFVCRAVVGGSTFSQHAYGLAVDINPFQNPYRKGDVVLPELATSYLDRDNVRPGMILEGSSPLAAFDAIGWGWGGRWNSLDDYHHFSQNNK